MSLKQKIKEYFESIKDAIIHKEIDKFNIQKFYIDYLVLCDDELSEKERRHNLNIYFSEFYSHQKVLDDVCSVYQYHRKHYFDMCIDIIMMVYGFPKELVKEAMFLTNINHKYDTIGISYIRLQNGGERAEPIIGNVKTIIEEKYPNYEHQQRLNLVSKYINHSPKDF